LGTARRSLAERFWAKVDRGESCWLWRGARTGGGYGQIGSGGRGGRQLYAHRVRWEMEYGPIPADMFVLHRCDNPPCVRIDHLWLGTPQDNMDDMRTKGRWLIGRHDGERNGRAKLTRDRVRSMRRLYTYGILSTDLGWLFSISPAQALQVVRGKWWKE
jgi:hypothetical protein